MKRFLARARRYPRGEAQRLLPFRERQARLEAAFRRSIVAATLLGLAAIGLAMPEGRAALLDQLRRARWAAWRGIGLEPDRGEVDADWAGRRDRGEVRERAAYRRDFRTLTPAQRALLEAAGMGPEDAVVRWGNYDATLVFSSKVYERDDAGRSYRLRPDARSLFLGGLRAFGLDHCQFYVPDTPEVRRLAAEAKLDVSTARAQSTNSWGCRGAEPDPDASVRGLVLGDSFMQGFLLADDETPPLCLQRTLQAELGVATALLNTGVLGYGPEQYFHTLRALGDRFRPRFVVVAVYANDFGDEAGVFEGEGDWREGGHWLDRIQAYCLNRNILCVFAPVPAERQVVGKGRLGEFPGRVSNLASVLSDQFCDPTDAFVTEDLRIDVEERRNRFVDRSALYNGALGDAHLSARGAELWGRIVGRRLALLLQHRKLAPRRKPASP